MSPRLPSPLSPYACTICKCRSGSLKFTRTSTAWVNNCSTPLSSTAQVSCALSSVYEGSWPLGGGSLSLLQVSQEALHRRTELRTSLTSITFLLIHITAWHLFPYHSASYNGGSFREQPYLPFSGSLFLRAVEKEQVRRGRESVVEHCEISSCQPHSFLMSALSKWDVCRDEMHWCSFISDPWAFTS